MKKIFFCLILFAFINSSLAYSESEIQEKWYKLLPIVQTRINQSRLKMKLTIGQAQEFIEYINNLDANTTALLQLQQILPKTTIELLISTKERNVSISEAEKMATYLKGIVEYFKFKNYQAFDENTSHIIGREWHEIDYSGENKTWQEQKARYFPQGVKNFKSVESLAIFIPLELKLPYFRKIYLPQNAQIYKDKLS